MRKGQVVKVLHNGHKAYGVVNGQEASAVVVRMIFEGELIAKTVAIEECRTPHFPQDGSFATFIRQTVGVQFEKEELPTVRTH